MANSTWINTDALLASIAVELKAELLAAAEPAVQAALREVERAMRRKLAEFVVGRIDQSYDVQRAGDVIHIQVQLGRKP